MLLAALLTKVVVATTLALAAGAFRRSDRRPDLGFAAWAVVLLVLLVPPVLTLPIGVPAPVASALSMSAPGLSTLVAEVRASFDGPIGARSPVAVAATVAKAPGVAFSPADGLGVAAWCLTAVWLVGVLAIAAHHRRARRALATVVSCALDADADLRGRADRIAAAVGVATPRVVVADGTFSPFLWHPLRGVPTIVMPARLVRSLRSAELDSIVRHEMLHVRRRDALRHRVESLAVALWWWLPTSWIALRRVREFEELCIDRAVVRARPSAAPHYARALLATEAFLAGAAGDATSTRVVPALARPGLVERRVRGIVSAVDPSEARSSRGALLLLALVLPLGAITAVGASPSPSPIDAAPATRVGGDPHPEARAWPRPRRVVEATGVAAIGRSNAAVVSTSTMVETTEMELEGVIASVKAAVVRGEISTEDAFARIAREKERLLGPAATATKVAPERSAGFRAFERELKRAWRAGTIDETEVKALYARALAIEESDEPFDRYVDSFLVTE